MADVGSTTDVAADCQDLRVGRELLARAIRYTRSNESVSQLFD